MKSSNEPDDLMAQLSSGKLAVGENGRVQLSDGRDLAAVLLGRRGGLKGGKARAQNLTPEKRTEIARRAATARWGNKG
jgi:hypothetical protein